MSTISMFKERGFRLRLPPLSFDFGERRTYAAFFFFSSFNFPYLS
jgi:hypothetical protein